MVRSVCCADKSWTPRVDERDQQHEFQLEEVTDQQDPRMVPALRTLRACLHPSASPAPGAGAGGACAAKQARQSAPTVSDDD
jgi:hypothetical protein